MQELPIRQDKVHHVIARVIDLIQRNVIHPGERIPSERDLAEMFNVSRGTVRSATQILAFNKILTIKHGSGIYFNALPEHVELLSSLLQNDNVNTNSSHDFLLQCECRLIMEPQAAILAAIYAKDTQIEKLHATIGKMQEYIENGFLGGYAMEDMYFHRLIGEATGNRYIIQAIEAYLFDCNFLCAFGSTPNLSEESFVQHCAIYEAIATHDTDKAHQLSKDHVFYAMRINKCFTNDNDINTISRKGINML